MGWYTQRRLSMWHSTTRFSECSHTRATASPSPPSLPSRAGRIIEMFEPLVALMPQVKMPSPEERQKLKIGVRLFWTVMALLVYLVCSQVPLYGVNKGGMSDPFYLMRVILASNKGTLMELGISPIITSGTIMQASCARGARPRRPRAPAPPAPSAG